MMIDARYLWGAAHHSLRSMINIGSGARTRLSSFIAGVALRAPQMYSVRIFFDINWKVDG